MSDGVRPFYRRATFVEALNGWLFCLPVVLGTLLLNVLPAIPNFYYSLTSWNGLNAPEYIGLRNYGELTTNFDFLNSLRVTATFALWSIPLSMAAGLGLALLVSRPTPIMTFFRAVYYTPVIASLIAVVMVFHYLLAPRFGLINLMLWNVFGVNGPNWLGQSETAMMAIVIVSVFTGAGYNMVLFLAGLTNIPDHLYEAARIDGANAWHRFRHITMPLLTPTTFFIFVLAVIGSFNVFALVLAMTGGGPGRATEVLFFLLYQQAFERLRFGFASAMACFMFVFLGLLTWLNWWLSKRWVFYG
jgi:multiple sugar transport system permease protein